MQELVSKYEFVEPNVKIELEGELGLNLYEIAKSLQTRYAEVKEKLERMSIAGRITIVAYTVIVVNKGFHKHEEKVPILPVSEAKFFVAKYDNEIGDAYTRFLIKCEETLLKKMREELSKPKAPHYISLAIPRVKGDSQALAHKRNMTAFFSAFERIKGRKPSHDDIKIYVSGLNKKIYGTHEKQMRDENTLLG